LAASVPTVVDETSGLWYRPSVVGDLKMLREVESAYDKLPIKDDDVFLDLGAHVGAASMFALKRGAAKVIAVEPDPSNLELLHRNLDGSNVQIIEAAVGDRSGTTMLYTRASKPHLSTTESNEPGREAIEVSVIALGDLLRRYRPTILKCDIEFGEYALTRLGKLSPTIRAVAIEIHIRYDLVFDSASQSDTALRIKRREALTLVDTIEAQGFTRVAYRTKEYPGPRVTDDTGLPPDTASIEGVWVRSED